MFKIILALLLMIVSTSVEAQFIFPSGGGGGAATSVVVGTTTITGGTTTRILYDNAGVLGEYTLTGTGTVVAMQTSPSLTTPNINVATGTSLALGGATIGTNALAVTGTASFSGIVTGGSVVRAADGSNTAPSYSFTNSTGTGLYQSSNALLWAAGGTASGVFGGSYIGLPAASAYAWSSTSAPLGTADTMLSRNAAGVTQFGTTAANASGAWLAAKGTLTGGTLADQAKVLAITATQPATITGTQNAIAVTVTGAGSSSQTNYAHKLLYSAGYTGTSFNAALNVVNTNAGSLSSGLFVGLADTTPSVGAALIVDNGATTQPIFLARDNGSTVFTIADGGLVTSTVGFRVTGSISNIDNGGDIHTTNTTGYYSWGTRNSFKAPADGVYTFFNFAETGVDRLQFGGTTSSFPALKRNGTALEHKLADDSDYSSLTATTAIFNTLASDSGQTTATVCAENTTGQLYKGSGTVGICLGTSSARYKNRIYDLTAGLSEIEQLQPKRFWYNKDAGDNGAKEQVGFLAEDVAKVLPNLVGLDSEDRPNTLDMIGMIPVIIKAIQELKADNDNLRAIITRRAANGG